ncbi:MAG: hypothetical protein ACOC84_07930, partial [Actinomycetota bacterium]
LVLVEYRKNHLEVLTLPPASQTPVLATRFRVFEEKNYSDSTPRAAAEPRELTIADLNGDGQADLLWREAGAGEGPPGGSRGDPGRRAGEGAVTSAGSGTGPP